VNGNKIKQRLTGKDSLFRTKAFWVIFPVGILFMIGTIIPAYQILQLPFGILIVGAMPGLFAIKFSIPFSVRFAKIHMKWHKKSHTYNWNELNTKDPSTWKFAIRTSAYSFAIIYNIVSWSRIEEVIFINVNKLILITPIAVFSLLGAIIIHVSIFLLTKSGLMYENIEDGTRMSLGRDLLTRLDWAIGPMALISLGYSVWKNIYEPFTLSFIFSLIFIFVIILYSSFFSFYFLKKVHLDKLMKTMREKLPIK